MKAISMLTTAVFLAWTNPAVAGDADGPVASLHPDFVLEVDTGERVNTGRERVLAELRAAHELGLLMIGEGNLPCASTEEERVIQQAGEMAMQRLEAARQEILAVQQWIRRAK